MRGMCARVGDVQLCLTTEQVYRARLCLTTEQVAVKAVRDDLTAEQRVQNRSVSPYTLTKIHFIESGD